MNLQIPFRGSRRKSGNSIWPYINHVEKREIPFTLVCVQAHCKNYISTVSYTNHVRKEIIYCTGIGVIDVAW